MRFTFSIRRILVLTTLVAGILAVGIRIQSWILIFIGIYLLGYLLIVGLFAGPRIFHNMRSLRKKLADLKNHRRKLEAEVLSKRSRRAEHDPLAKPELLIDPPQTDPPQTDPQPTDPPMRFTKMHGAGNDYVYVDCFNQETPQDPPGLSIAVADRHKGIGGDGLILICPSEIPDVDARMRMFNADGSEAEMCGNGIRCVAKYIYDHEICRKTQLKIETGAGILALDVAAENGRVQQVRVNMGEPALTAAQIPTTLCGGDAPDRVINVPLSAGGHEFLVTCVSMGNPHCVIFVDKATDDLVHRVGPLIENDARFPARINVEFVEVISTSEVRQRTWERGSGETLACGTGASAVCVAGVLSGRTERILTNHLLGGTLQLEWDESTNHVFMTGPATEVFSGTWPVQG